MLQGQLAVAVIPAEGLEDHEHSLLMRALASPKIDIVVLSTRAPEVKLPDGVIHRLRASGETMGEILEDLFGAGNQDIMLDENLPLVIVYLTEPVDLDAACEFYESSRRKSLISVEVAPEADYILNQEGEIRGAYPRLVTDDPVRYVVPSGDFAIFDYTEFKQNGELIPLESVGFAG